jgi:uncharacterized protein
MGIRRSAGTDERPEDVRGESIQETAPPPVEIDHRALSPEALLGVVESFVGREGTDYGLHEKTLAEKVADVLAQIQRGEAVITFDPASESVNIIARR